MFVIGVRLFIMKFLGDLYLGFGFQKDEYMNSEFFFFGLLGIVRKEYKGNVIFRGNLLLRRKDKENVCYFWQFRVREVYCVEGWD